MKKLIVLLAVGACALSGCVGYLPYDNGPVYRGGGEYHDRDRDRDHDRDHGDRGRDRDEHDGHDGHDRGDQR